MLTSSRAGKKIGIFDLIFETSDNGVLKERLRALALSATKSYCHYSNFLLAVSGGAVAGTICGYEPRVATHDVFTKALAELGVDEGYQERIATFLLVKPEIDRQTWVVDFMTVNEGYNPLTVFAELIKKSLLSARLKGYRKAQTMVEIGSSDAQILYEKLGFEVMDEKRSELYDDQFGRAGIKRLQMAL
ncbi:acyl-CoA acyltransferase [Sulfurimonas sp. HSL-3221]|uniref:acyl-CoA acyltransferase n=1 Tax=Sulfurimonadaceae TaxID=2771471 RepID=UPI001E2BAA79|nr:acyl-CoA acyltransferase [Sulfurimonas sp. HSL-3221]UFS63110.1 acyl-CoA acyltransferase [Sulfurimonas sp. HSL-3221]